MIRKIRRGLLVALLITLIPLGLSPSTAQSDKQRFFPETGHWVSGDFLETYESIDNPTEIFGYPITDDFTDEKTWQKIQYFQRARFELHPENPPELRVVLTLLGELLYKPGKVLPIQANFPACRFYPETDHSVCYAFLNFFDANWGVAQFGYPMSDIEIHNGRIVQYFQRSAFEWHPERPSGHRVVLALLGSRYFWESNENPLLLAPNKDVYISKSILNLRVKAFVEMAVLSKSDTQTIYVIVQDQNLQPIPNAQVILTIRYPSGAEETLVIPKLTDDGGITQWSFVVEDEVRGIVEVSAAASYDTLKQNTRTSFRIWW